MKLSEVETENLDGETSVNYLLLLFNCNRPKQSFSWNNEYLQFNCIYNLSFFMLVMEFPFKYKQYYLITPLYPLRGRAKKNLTKTKHVSIASNYNNIKKLIMYKINLMLVFNFKNISY